MTDDDTREDDYAPYQEQDYDRASGRQGEQPSPVQEEIREHDAGERAEAERDRPDPPPPPDVPEPAPSPDPVPTPQPPPGSPDPGPRARDAHPVESGDPDAERRAVEEHPDGSRGATETVELARRETPLH
jgi:hypothetical protein